MHRVRCGNMLVFGTRRTSRTVGRSRVRLVGPVAFTTCRSRLVTSLRALSLDAALPARCARVGYRAPGAVVFLLAVDTAQEALMPRRGRLGDPTPLPTGAFRSHRRPCRWPVMSAWFAVSTGFEPAPSGLTGRRELQTSPRDQWVLTCAVSGRRVGLAACPARCQKLAGRNSNGGSGRVS